MKFQNPANGYRKLLFATAALCGGAVAQYGDDWRIRQMQADQHADEIEQALRAQEQQRQMDRLRQQQEEVRQEMERRTYEPALLPPSPFAPDRCCGGY